MLIQKRYFVPAILLALFILTGCQGGVPGFGGDLAPEGVQEMIDAAVAKLPVSAPALTADEIRGIIKEELVQVQPAVEAPSSGAVIEPIPGPTDDGTACQNKLWTYPANFGPDGKPAVIFEFEIQSQNPQMNDFYTPGNKTILVLERSIEPNERSDYASGWGSAWVIYDDRPGCEEFDIVGNAVKHAESRLDQGHAGLVVDFRDSGTAMVVAMLPDLPRDEAERLWDMYTGARHDGEDSVPADLTYAQDLVFLLWPEGAELLEVTGACPATRGRDFPAAATVGPLDHFVVLQPWGDGVPNGQVNYILPTGLTVSFPAGVKGGAAWEYPATCVLNQVVQDLTGNPLPLYHLEGGSWVLGPPSE